MGNGSNILCPRWKEREESHPPFYIHCKLSETTLDFLIELINLTTYLISQR